MHAYRTHNCGQLDTADVGHEVRLSGWVHRVRDHGGILFIDLRDHHGITQLLADPDSPAFAAAEKVRAEWVVRIDGVVKARAPELVNAKIPTGEIEVFVAALEVLSAADELPLPVFGDVEYPEETRLTYRFLDLRRERLHRNMMLRSAVMAATRRRMEEVGFTDFQTPILTASSPEGARDFIVPSRLHPGKVYALPQAPQQFKQLIMVAGFDRYYQIAPCFRDEDPRADRSPGEFYQLDVEMSFVTQDDVLAAIEPVMRGLFEEFGEGRPVTQAFPRIAYADALRWYGSDKPDLRNPLKMQDVSEHFAGSGFKIFAQILQKEMTEIRAIPAPGGGSRAFCDRMNSWAQREGLPGMGYIFWRGKYQAGHSQIADALWELFQGRSGDASLVREIAQSLSPGDQSEIEGILYRLEAGGSEAMSVGQMIEHSFGKPEGSGPIAKNIGDERTEAIRQKLNLKSGDAAFFLAGKPDSFVDVAGRARNVIGEELKLTDKERFELAWIVDFPMYEWDDEGKKVDFSHNPFSMPQGGLEALEAKDPLDVLAWQYDLACNGYEIVSGGIRNHKPEIMFRAFEIAGYARSEVEKRFGGMVNAFRYGAPPHGGCAAGMDRIVMLLAGEQTLREVVMFPKNQRAEDLMMGAPSEPTNEQLRELGMRFLPRE